MCYPIFEIRTVWRRAFESGSIIFLLLFLKILLFVFRRLGLCSRVIAHCDFGLLSS